MKNWNIGTRITAGFAAAQRTSRPLHQKPPKAKPAAQQPGRNSALANLHESVVSAGTAIALGAQAGHRDAQDHDFTEY